MVRKLAVLSTFLVTLVLMCLPAYGQSQAGHVYTIRYHQVHQGQEQAYNKAYADIVRPVLDELKKREVIVSYLDLVQISGAGKTSHLLMVEYPNMAALDTINEKIAEASQKVLGKPFSEALVDFPKMRDYLRTEFYGAPIPQ